MRNVLAVLTLLILLSAPTFQAATTLTIEQDRVELSIPAVGQRQDGSLFGIASDLEVVIQRPGTGRVFVSTQPLTQVDMQGSARLAVDAAAAITGKDANAADFFFTVTTPAITIGGPSAGGAMAVAVVALLQGWPVRQDVVMTGMINPDGSIGPIGGVLQKLEAADSVGAKAFLVPLGQAVARNADGHVVDVKSYGRQEYGIEVIEVADLYDAVGPFTGNRLVRPTPSSDPLKDAEYTNLTNRLSENLTARSLSRQADLHTRFAQAQVNTQSDRERIQQQLQTGDAQLQAAHASRNASKHYLGASQAFQSLVSYGYAEALIAFFEGQEDSPQAYSDQYLDTTDAFLATVAREIKSEFPLQAAQLDSTGASEDRYIEAQGLQAQARQALAARNFGDTLRLSSFARERGESARWWSEIGREVAQSAPSHPITQEMLRALLDKYTDAANLELEYAALIASEQTNFAAATQSFATSQRARQDGWLAASLTNLVETFARTSTALVQLSGADPVRARLPGLADAAAYEIEVARGEGIPPIYAISVLELGQSLVETDPVAAYALLLQARILARTSLLAANVSTPTPGVQPYRGSFGLSTDASVWIGFLVVFGTISLVLVLLILRAERRRKEPAPEAPRFEEVPPASPPVEAPASPPPTFILVDPEPEPAPPPHAPGPWSPLAHESSPEKKPARKRKKPPTPREARRPPRPRARRRKPEDPDAP